MKKIPPPLNILTLSLLFILSACSTTDNKQEKIYASSITNMPVAENLQESDRWFLTRAYSTGLFKIALAKEALVRSTSEEAVQFASAINTFYTNLNSEIEQMAETYKFDLPMDISDDQKLVWKKLVKEKGWEFDKKFRELFEQYYGEDKALFENAAIETSDKSVALLAEKAKPQINRHQKLSNILCEKIEAKTMIYLAKEVKKPAKVISKQKVVDNAIAKF